MRTVHKYPFGIEDTVVVPMPAGAQVLHVEMQGSTPCLWALVDTERPVLPRTFYVRGTGHPVEVGMHHVGSFLMAGGRLVWHVFYFTEAQGYIEEQDKLLTAGQPAGDEAKL